MKATKQAAEKMENIYVTTEYIGGVSHSYAGVLMQALGWDVATTIDLPDDDPTDYESPCSASDVHLRVGPTSNEGLIARSKAIDWARKLGVPYRERA